MKTISLLIVLAVASYLFGNINWALIISKFKKSDIRKLGSGNPGTLNMSRNFGLKTGLLVFFLDISKGAICSLVAFFVFRGQVFENTNFVITDFATYLCGLSAVLGHIFPVFLKFKGGKGIASTIGLFLVCESIHGWQWSAVCIMAIVAALVFIYFTEFGAMGSFIAITPPAISGCIRLFYTYAQSSTQIPIMYIVTNMLILCICFFTWFAHRTNIERMLKGEEHPTSIKEMVVKMKAKKLQEKQKKEQISNSQTVNEDKNL